MNENKLDAGYRMHDAGCMKHHVGYMMQDARCKMREKYKT
jgi:hypothetical protein